MMPFTALTIQRSHEQIVQQIQDGIRDGTLAQGQKLPTEREMGETFGVSRGVVREAIKVLDALGLVESRQGSGVYVRDDPLPSVSRALILSVSLEEKSIERLFEFRRALEVLAARGAAGRRTTAQAAGITAAAAVTMECAAAADAPAFGPADRQLHAAIGEAADNPYLSVALGAVNAMQRDVVGLFAGFPGSMVMAAEQHLRIAEAIAAGTPDTAANVMAEHLVYAAETVLRVLRETSGERGSAATAVSDGDGYVAR